MTIKSPTPKELRKVYRLFRDLCNPRAFSSYDAEEEKPPLRNWLARRLVISAERELLLSHEGYATLRALTALVDEVDVFEGLANYSDIFNGCAAMFVECIKSHQDPETGEEVIDCVRKQVDPKIDIHEFVFPLLGMVLEKEVKELRLGPYRICRPSAQVIHSLGVESKPAHLDPILEIHKHYLWLMGSARGTSRVAFERFRAEADAFTGFLAMYLGNEYEGGGASFSVRAATVAEQFPGRSAWMTWRHSKRSLGTNHNFLSSEHFKVNREQADRLEQAELLRYCFGLPSKPDPTDLEAALLRAVTWLDDASHERRPVMRLLKVWSCAEVFFSLRTDVAQSVCDGIVAALTRGPTRSTPPSEVEQLGRDLKWLYDKRSRATHSAQHAHVTKGDCEKLTAWICGMLLNMAVIAANGIESVDEGRQMLLEQAGGQ